MSSITPRTGPATPREASRVYALCVGLENMGCRIDHDDEKVREHIRRWMRLVWCEYRREAKTRSDTMRTRPREDSGGRFVARSRRPEE